MHLEGRLKGFLFVNLALIVIVFLILFSLPVSNADGTTNSTAPSPSTTPISVSNVLVSSITIDSAAITWNTDLPSNSYVYYKLTADVSYLNNGISDSVTSHAVQLTGLQAGSSYSYYVQSCDQISCGKSTESTFATQAIPSPSPSFSPSVSPSPASSPSPSPSASPSPSSSISPSPSTSPSPTISPSPSVQISPSPSASIIPSPSPSPSPSASASPSPSPSASPSPSITPSPLPSVSPSSSPSPIPPTPSPQFPKPQSSFGTASFSINATPTQGTILRAQACLAEGYSQLDGYSYNQGAWDRSCKGTYPSSTCAQNGDRVACNDGINETQLNGDFSWDGVNLTYYNSSITDCKAIDRVYVCYEWWINSAHMTTCDISIANTEPTLTSGWTAIVSTCPGTTANPGVTCVDVTSRLPWNCSNFFGSSGKRAQIKSELIDDSWPTTAFWDVLHYNVTYTNATCDALTDRRTLSSGFSANGSCYLMNTSNVLLDCAGYTITGNTTGVGINISNANNVIVQNCVISNFSTGLYASNSNNITLINNTFLNNTAYGISIANSVNGTYTNQTLNWNSPLAQASAAGLAMYVAAFNNLTAVVIKNFSLSNNYGGASTNAGSAGGPVYGFSLNNSNNVSVVNLTIANLFGGAPADASSGGVAGNGSNATALWVNGSNNIFNIVSLTNITGSNGASYTGTNGNGGSGGAAFALYLSSLFNNTFMNFTVNRVFGGIGGTGDLSNAGTGGKGGNAYFMYGMAVQNSSFSWISVNNVSAGNGARGGDTSGLSGGDGGDGGHAIGIQLQSSSSNTNMTGLTLYYLVSGIGGNAGMGAGGTGNAGFGGNATALWLNYSSNLNLQNSLFNYTYASMTGGTDGLPVSAGHSFGAFIMLSNSTYLANVTFFNVSSGTIGGAFGSSLIVPLYLEKSSQAAFVNSVFNYTTIAANRKTFAIYLTGGSVNATFLNTTFNRSSNFFAGAVGTNTITVAWYLAINVSNGTAGQANVLVRTYNSTSSSVPMGSQATGSSGIIFSAVSEYTANGTYSYTNQCSNQANVSCYTNHLVQVNDSNNNITVTVTMNQSRLLKFLLCPSVLGESASLIGNTTYGGATCYTLNASNLTLDCAGFALIGSRTAGVPAIYANLLNNVTIKNCYITNWTAGIQLNFTSNSLLLNNTIYANNQTSATGSTTTYGIIANNSYYLNITNNTIYKTEAYSTKTTNPCGGAQAYGLWVNNASNLNMNYVNASSSYSSGYYYDVDAGGCLGTTSGYGAYLATILNANVNNSYFDNAGYTGILFSSVNSSVASNVFARSNAYYGVVLTKSFNNSFSNITAISNYVGVADDTGSNNTLRQSYFSGNTVYGLWILSTNHTLLNSIIEKSQIGIYMGSPGKYENISNNIVRHSWVTTSSRGAITCNTVTDSWFSNNTVYNTTDSGGASGTSAVALQSCNRIIFSGNNFTNGTSYGIWTSLSYDINMTNDIFSNINLTHVFINSNSNLTLINVSFNKSSNSLCGGNACFLYVMYFLTVNVTNSTNNSVSGASVNITNSSGANVVSTLTDSNGLVSNLLLPEYAANGSYSYNYATGCVNATNIVCATNYTILTQKSGYSDNTTIVNLNYSQVINIKLSLAPVTTLSFTLTLPGQTPVSSNTTVPPDSPSTAIMNFTLNASNYTEGNQLNVQPCIGASLTDCQNSTVPFFNLTNTGNAVENWWIKLNVTLPSTIIMKCSKWNSNSTSNALTIANSTFNGWVKLDKLGINTGQTISSWCWADFTNAAAGTTAARLDHNATDCPSC